MVEQGEDAPADEAAGGLVAGDEQQPAGDDLVLGQGAALVMDVNEGRDVVVARFPVPLGDKRPRYSWKLSWTARIVTRDSGEMRKLRSMLRDSCSD
ncbi:hypothetical protein [Streptomyces sp. NPDC047061]|uniref:hypothetical protein n=1 Tax=Streptomyces sp. NPDC047061 TaxID=3154605 RepID=UPI0033CEAACD